jgi:hypothetical protein
MREAQQRGEREWRMESFTFRHQGVLFALTLRFRWGGEVRTATYRWEPEEQFQNIDSDKVVAYS